MPCASIRLLIDSALGSFICKSQIFSSYFIGLCLRLVCYRDISATTALLSGIESAYSMTFPFLRLARRCPEVAPNLTAAVLKIPDSGFLMDLRAVQPFTGRRLTGKNAAKAADATGDGVKTWTTSFTSDHAPFVPTCARWQTWLQSMTTHTVSSPPAVKTA